jgi:hypothetical protein
MYRVDEFLEYCTRPNRAKSCYDGKWVNARPLPFYYGILTKGYWIERKKRMKDAKAVLQGKAVAVTWEG